MAVSVEIAFLLLGGLIFIGYFGELLSRKFAIPTALLLLAIGYGLKSSGFVAVEDFIGLQDLFGSLALVVLLFDGGMSLNVLEVMFKSGRVLLVGLVITILSMIGGGLLFALVGYNPFLGVILGAIAGGIGSSTTISIAKSISLPDNIRNFLTLESSITDVFSIILAIVLTQSLVSGIFDVQILSAGIVGKFSIGLFVGIAVGITSIALSRIEREYNYMVTLAAVLMTFAVTEFLGGSGAIAVLTFGVLLGNEALIRKTLKMGEVEAYPMVKQFQTEISFFIRTFFFVFLGIVVTLGNTANFLIALMLIILLYVIRYIVISLATANTAYSAYKNTLTAINPRGLATAVLATYPLIVLQKTIETSPNSALESLIPSLLALSEIAFYLIILSIVFTTLLVPLTKNKEAKKAEQTNPQVQEMRLDEPAIEHASSEE
ncbi:MAG: cation:proton antiporter [archaeon]|nr:cation:proton antiporter [archaeon]